MTRRTLTAPTIPQGGQRGPTCGIYCLHAVATVLGAVVPVPTKAGQAVGDSIRQRAKQNGRTVIGEIFSANDMRLLATDIGLTAAIVDVSEHFLTPVRTAIDNNRYVLAPFGVNDTGMPQNAGDRPHWGIIYGYDTGRFSLVRALGFSTVIFKHPWSNNPREAYVDTFKRSNRALQDWPQQYWIKRRSGADPNAQAPLHAHPDFAKMSAGNLRYKKGGLGPAPQNQDPRLSYREIPATNLSVTLAGKIVTVCL